MADVKPGLFGIEIEAEGQGMTEIHNQYWHTENDGSLRGGYPEGAAEFVLDAPIKREQVEDAIESLQKALKGAKFNFSYRTSVHVHVNVQELTYVQVLNIIYTYLLLEEPLMTYCGKERKANRFCLRVVDAEGFVDQLYELFNGGERQLQYIEGDAVRYSSINIAALNKYGSLEFRAMRGNMDKEVIKTWTEALYHIREYAITKVSPKEILADFQATDPKTFMSRVLKDVYQSFTYPRMVKEMQRSFSLTLDLPYAYKEEEKKAVKQKPVPAYGGVQMVDVDHIQLAARWNMAQPAVNPEADQMIRNFEARQAEIQARADEQLRVAAIPRPRAPRVAVAGRPRRPIPGG